MDANPAMNDPVVDLDALLHATEVSMDIRGRYATAGYTKHRYWTYVLLLEGGFFYVGSTNNPFTRLLDHELQSESSALWVRHRGPVVRVLELIRHCTPEDEKYKYYEYCSIYGWEVVRGASYCHVHMPRPPAGLEDFSRNRADFDYLPRAHIDAVHAKVKELAAQYEHLAAPI